MKKFIIIIFVLVLIFFSFSSIYSSLHIDNINKFVDIHYFNNQINENIDYWGVFNNYHFFLNYKTNKVYLYKTQNMQFYKKYELIFRNTKKKLGRIRVVTFIKNRLWVVDKRNRVTLFKYGDSGFIEKGTFYSSGIEVLYNIKATQKGFYGFGKNYRNNFRLISYSYLGTKRKIIKKFGNKIKGNIILSQDTEGYLLYSFIYSSRINYLGENQKSYTLSHEIKYQQNDDKEKKNGILYNIAIYDNFLVVTYWTVDSGGLIEIYNKNTNELAVTINYPIGQGRVYKKSIFIYRESFQDNKLRSFIVEFELSKILGYLKNK